MLHRQGIVLACALACQLGSALAQQSAPAVFARQLSGTELDTRRGGERTEVTNTITLHGSADNIRVQDSITGNNSIGGGSFAGAQGFPIVIQNSGNGVLIQNATIINVTVRP